MSAQALTRLAARLVEEAQLYQDLIADFADSKAWTVLNHARKRLVLADALVVIQAAAPHDSKRGPAIRAEVRELMEMLG